MMDRVEVLLYIIIEDLRMFCMMTSVCKSKDRMTDTVFVVSLASIVLAYAGGVAVGWWIKDSITPKKRKQNKKSDEKIKNRRIPNRRRR